VKIYEKEQMRGIGCRISVDADRENPPEKPKSSSTGPSGTLTGVRVSREGRRHVMD
jgi:hypothetical protein